jgi:hypothetical protein
MAIEPPQVAQRPGRWSGVSTVVERPQEKQYKRKCMTILRLAGRSSAGGSSSTRELDRKLGRTAH